jgi:hypothetical protein
VSVSEMDLLLTIEEEGDFCSPFAATLEILAKL